MEMGCGVDESIRFSSIPPEVTLMVYRFVEIVHVHLFAPWHLVEHLFTTFFRTIARSGAMFELNERMRSHCVYSLLDVSCSVFENLTVSAQEPLQGVRVRAHGRPDFVIKRHYEIVCVVEVKSGEVWRGWGQNTVAALGIVTYLHTWNLLTSRGPIIEFENVVLPLVQGSPTPEMLDFVCSKISGALHAILE
jgi:hypothetical protein